MQSFDRYRIYYHFVHNEASYYVKMSSSMPFFLPDVEENVLDPVVSRARTKKIYEADSRRLAIFCAAPDK